jgi:hypothetical protein
MNAVEIEEAISELAGQPFNSECFPYAFLRAFGNKETTIKRLKVRCKSRQHKLTGSSGCWQTWPSSACPLR